MLRLRGRARSYFLGFTTKPTSSLWQRMQSGPSTASCYFFQDRSGYCNGTLRSFRESSDASALLALQTYADANDYTSRLIYLTWQSQNRVVYLNSGAALAAVFDRAATAVDGNIYVSFTSDNNISAMQLWNASYYL